MTIHLLRSGRWQTCATVGCPEAGHLELDVTEAQNMPQEMVEAVFAAVDPPTVINEDGQFWHGGLGAPGINLHREYGLPASIYNDGTRVWHHLGELHRDYDLPAIVRATGDTSLMIVAQDKVGSVRVLGTQEWWIHGQRHRVQGPAVVNSRNDLRMWYRHGKLHRADGPAIMRKRVREWWVQGVQYPRAEYVAWQARQAAQG